MTNEPTKKPRTRKPAANKTPNTPNALRGATVTDTPLTIADSDGQLRVDASTSDAPQTTENRLNEKVGGDRLSSAEAPLDALCLAEIQLIAHARSGENRTQCWERLRKEARAVGMPKNQGPGTAYEWATREVERLFPPPVLPEPADDPEPEAEEPATEPPEAAPAIVSSDDMGVSGLGDMPPDWPQLPANAQLQVEIAWVSANRLRVRSGSGVDLSRALSPAPSYSALSWLETSILFPAKFADISVKATAQQDDEREGIRREKLAIDEIRGLLAEMLE